VDNSVDDARLYWCPGVAPAARFSPSLQLP
jgi:hypothetical protein